MAPRQPHPWQTAAVTQIAQKLLQGRGVLCDGQTGCGKTLISGLALKEVALQEAVPQPVCAIALVPCLGGAVPLQWRRELIERMVKDGLHVELLEYRGAHRHQQLSTFVKAFQAAKASQQRGLFVLITTPQTLQSEGAKTLARLPLTVGVIDEAHWCASGSPPMSLEEVDPTKKRYVALNDLHSRCGITWLMLTATPVRNQTTDMYSLARLGRWGCRKENWLVKAESEGYAQASAAENAIIEEHTVNVCMPEELCPETTTIETCHWLAEEEKSRCEENWEELQKRTADFRKILAICRESPTPRNLEDKKRAQRAFEAVLTRGRRGMLHPFFFDDCGSPTGLQAAAKRLTVAARTDGPKEQEEEDAPDLQAAVAAFQKHCLEAVHGPLQAWFTSPSKLAEAAKSLHADPRDMRVFKEFEKALGAARRALSCDEWSLVARRFPLAQCSKTHATVGLLRKLSERKVLVLAFYAEPLDLLECYIKEAMPDRPVLVHHGKRDMRQAMDSFRSLDAPAIMLATRGSVGEGVSMEWTYPAGAQAVATVRLDAARTLAEEKQCEGRMKRPLAQPDVTAWFCHDVRVKDMVTIETWLQKVQAIKGHRAKTFAGEDCQEENEEGAEDEGLDVGILQALLNLAGAEGEAKAEDSSQAKKHKGAGAGAATISPKTAGEEKSSAGHGTAPPARGRKRSAQASQTPPPVKRHATTSQIPGMRTSTSQMQGHGVDEPEALEEALRRSRGLQARPPVKASADAPLKAAAPGLLLRKPRRDDDDAEFQKAVKLSLKVQQVVQQEDAEFHEAVKRSLETAGDAERQEAIRRKMEFHEAVKRSLETAGDAERQEAIRRKMETRPRGAVCATREKSPEPKPRLPAEERPLFVLRGDMPTTKEGVDDLMRQIAGMKVQNSVETTGPSRDLQ